MNSGGSSLGKAAPGVGAERWLLQPVGKVFEINEPLAQIRIARLHHAAAGFVANLLDRRLGGQAAADRIGDAATQPRSAANMR